MESLYTIRGSARHAARLLAVQLLYQKEQTGQPVEEVFRHFEEWYVTVFQSRNAEKKKPQPLDLVLLRDLTQGAASQSEASKKVLARYLAQNWTLERLPLVLRLILELGIYELTENHVPRPIVISEYVNLTKSFFDGSEEAFVNGLLDKVHHELVLTTC